jgi:RNA polymerase sigma-70 factor (ECF subfamily)
MTSRMTRTQRSFESLYHAHVSDVYRYALAVTGQTSDAEDVTQTTFLNAYRAYARGERPRKPQNWLLTIAHNVCRQRARFAYYRVREVELEESSAEALAPPDDVPTAADIRRALAHLPFQQRAVLIMRELEGRTHAEIAEVMGLTTQATEMLAFRARRALREHLADSLTCTQATSALDRQLDGTLDAESAGLLRAHLRECQDCERLARRLRAQQSAWKSLAVVPLPTSLDTFHGAGAAGVAGGGAVAGAGVAAKVASVTLAALSVGTSAYFVKLQIGPLHPRPAKPHTTHVRRHATKHVAVSHARWTAPAIAAQVPATTAPPVKHHHSPAATAPVPPAGTVTAGPPVQPVAPTQTDQIDQIDQIDQSTPPDGSTPAADAAQPVDPAQTTTTTSEHGNQGVRSHGSPTPPAQPNGDGPQGKSAATPPPYVDHK